ncbi:MAG TPA: Fic family protein [Cryptosporangiaceae bacterium]|nr:Fic family protein [Cryptosporangiaceae bacterium]
MTAYLDMGQLVAAARVALRAEPEVASRQALLRCVAEPAAMAGAVELYPTLADKAAALLVAVLKLHRPFVDGNKRAGFVAAALLVNVNGHRLDMPVPAASALIDKVDYGGLVEPTEVAEVLAPHIQPI